MGSGPSIFSKSPYEFAKEHQKRRLVPYMQRPVMYPPPHGFVVVQFLSRIELIHEHPFLDFEGYFPLDNKGGLDLGLIKKTWGLETCVPIDPMRWKIFQTGDDNYVSPLAVHLLGQPRTCRIRVTEPRISKHTKYQRAVRHVLVDLLHALVYLYQNVTLRTSVYIQYNTPLPSYYNLAVNKHRQLVSDYSHWHSDWEKEFGQGSVFYMYLLMFLVLFYLFIKSGYIEFGLRARFWEWVRTGQFGLPRNKTGGGVG
ncbi:hypothetical protein AX15_005366 [Amanita polypyramis BW_CC]|nr:hypothetical protein AX15_005366 [Amanita polypyramis BW_CC]